jgi:hypothetical protein
MRKVCTQCSEEKPLEEFSRSPQRHDGRGSWCKKCHAAYYRRKEKEPEYRERRRENTRRYRQRIGLLGRRKLARKTDLKRSYGLTPEAYAEMLQAQNGLCAICALPQAECVSSFHIDHVHLPGEVRKISRTKGKIRGLLCNECNLGLGKFKDNPEVLEKAAYYLRLHTEFAPSILQDGAVPV